MLFSLLGKLHEITDRKTPVGKEEIQFLIFSVKRV